MVQEIVIRRVSATPTAVIAARTTWGTLPTVWPPLLGEVWDCVRAGGIDHGCPNVMVYRDRGLDVEVEVGVELRQPCALAGRVVSSELPGGLVATTTHRGPYSELGQAHRAVADWCARHGHPPTQTRWEVYGPHSDDPTQLTTEIFWLLLEHGEVGSAR
jgi:effector-binding domain-containing protein